MKKFLRYSLLLVLSCISAVSANAAGYDNVTGTISWANGNETHATATAAIADAVLDTKVSVGTDLTVSGPTTYSPTVPEALTPLMTYLPTTSNAGTVAGDMIEYKVKVKKGITLKVNSVEFDVVKEGTDNAYISWSTVMDGVESDIVAYSDPKTQIRRNNNANATAPLTHTETVTSDAGREFSLRIYISNVANNKKMSVGNIKINATVNGEEQVRKFVDFALDFTSDPYKVTKPASGLPAGVEVSGTWHDAQHGYNTTTLTVPVDGPVRIKFGKCQYGATIATIKKGNDVIGTIDCGGACQGTADWVYNFEEPATLTIVSASYIPSIEVEACELLPMVNVAYYDTDGSLLGQEEVQGGSALAYKFGEADVKVPAGQKFRGWFASEQMTAVKIPAGYMLQENLKLYARATAVEVPTSTSRFIYDLTKPYFYVEDHEAITIDGKYYNTHGWLVNKNGNIKVQVAGKCYVTVSNCLYSAESTATVTDESGNKVAEFPIKATGDGAGYTFEYDGPAGWLTINFPDGSYTHGVSVWNVVEFLSYDEATGYYVVKPGDVSSFLMALNAVASKPNAKIFLPNGVYDLGVDVLTSVSGKNISIVGQSREKTIILNAPPKEVEGIGSTATLKNSATGLYLQDLTIRNAMTFNGGTGRAVTLQDCGTQTICKNVSLESYQDTYYSNNNSGDFYFEDGEIHGVVDYICGGGDVVYNRVKFVNEEIKNTTIAAPAAAKKFGYVMLDCSIDTKCAEFNFGRSWQDPSRLAWINTTILQPEKLAKSRFTIGGMNVAADKFKEYNSMDAQGNIISPASNVIEFTHSTGNKKYETILSAAEAAEYAVDKVFPTWRPDQIATQKVVEYAAISGNKLSWSMVEGAAAYAVFKNGEFYAIVLDNSTLVDDATATWTVRAANERGGFGEAVTAIANTPEGPYAEIELKVMAIEERYAKLLDKYSDISYKWYLRELRDDIDEKIAYEKKWLELDKTRVPEGSLLKKAVHNTRIANINVALNKYESLAFTYANRGNLIKAIFEAMARVSSTRDEIQSAHATQIVADQKTRSEWTAICNRISAEEEAVKAIDEDSTSDEELNKHEEVLDQLQADLESFIATLDGEATGINEVSANAQRTAVIYNLAGQKVNAQYKGIVVKGAKKIMK